jgi:long-chain acyl-CoA synthetase
MDRVPPLAFGDIARQHRRSYPDRIALVEGSYRLTWPELDDRVNRLANALRARGFGVGDRVLWLGQNSFRVFETLFAVAKLGGMICPVNWRLSAAEMSFVIEDFDPLVVLWQEDEIGHVVREARASVGERAQWFQHDGDGDSTYEALVSGHADDPTEDVDPDLPLLVLYTAAFEGRPNGAMLTHRNLIDMGITMAWVNDVTDQSTYLNSGPMFHVGNYMFAVPTLLFGGKNVVIRRVIATEICDLVERERCTSAFLVGPVVGQVTEANSDRRYDLSSLRVVGPLDAWGGMVGPDTSRWGTHPGGYGQTELSGFVLFNGHGGRGAGNSGRPAPVVAVRVVDADGREVAPGGAGEIAVRGSLVIAGYWNRPELNRRRMRGGWWHTTDLGRQEADGTITFLGTLTRMIRSGSENIYPSEVEACLEAHPAVEEAAVIGVPDARWNQVVKAIVVLREGATSTEDELLDHCRDAIASYKRPRAIEFADALPRADGGKDYAALDAAFGGGGYPGGENVGPDYTSSRTSERATGR